MKRGSKLGPAVIGNQSMSDRNPGSSLHPAAGTGRAEAPSLALALEPRFMYDAAGAPTAVAVAAAADPAAHQEPRATDAGVASAVSSGAAEAHRADVPADVGPFGSKAEIQLLEAGGSRDAPITDIVFVDARVPDLDTLPPRAGVEVVVIDPTRDGIAQVNEALAGYRGSLASIQFVGHGESGSFGIGGSVVNATTLSARAGEIARWGEALTIDGDLLIWGCDVASLAGGQALINGLASLTGADVAASIDTTGASHLGGDWELEAATGAIETALPFEAAAVAAWGHALDTPTITGATVLRVAEPSTLNAPGADTASLAGWHFNSVKTTNMFNVTAVVANTSVGALADPGEQGTSIAGGFNFTGTLDQVNAWLDQISFTAADVELGVSSATTTLKLTITNVTDTANPSSSRDIAVEVTPSNDPATIPDGVLTVTEGSLGTVITTAALTAVDPEVVKGSQVAAQLIYLVNGAPVYGYLTLDGARIGLGSIFTHQDVIDGKLRYVHTATGADQNAADSFSVLLNDGATPIAVSDGATVAIAITPVNQEPTISGRGAVYEGQPANATITGVKQSVVGNFITADGGGDPQDTDDTLSVRLTSLAQHGTLYFTGSATIGGVTESFVNRQITQADIDAGFVFAYTSRGGLTYANDGVDSQATGRPPNDSFGVEVLDGGGGTLTPAVATGTINLDIRAVNDEPVWVGTSTLAASVDTTFMVQLTTAMLNVTDVDSADKNITFRITNQSGLDQGRLVIDNGTPAFIPAGGTFTLADVKAGRVHYYQTESAAAGDTDTFTFQVVDNAVSLHWEASGNQFERPGGVYTGPRLADTLRNFAFTINLRQTPASTGVGDGLSDLAYTSVKVTSSYAGEKPGGTARGTLNEGGTILLRDGSGALPGLSYTATGVSSEQVVYTVTAFEGGDFGGWNGKLEKSVDNSWVALATYDTFTQADLNAGNVRFVHDGGEDFESNVRLSASAGILIADDFGGLVPDVWNTSFSFYIRPVNDAPVATGSTTNAINEGDTVLITTAHLKFSDPDDANSLEPGLESSATLPGGGDNYAFNNGNALTFKLAEQPANGKLEYRDDSNNWHTVDTTTLLQASWITESAATTRLRFIHDGGETLFAMFKVQATDRWSMASNEASVSFVVVPKNNAPQIAGTPTATDPVLPSVPTLTGAVTGPAANDPLTIPYEGAFAQITSAMLRAVDPDSTSTQVQYRITSAPAHGRIAYSENGLNFATIAVGASFTQADVDSGRIYYLHNGDEPSSSGYSNPPDDKFVFTLSDGAAEQVGNEFWIYVQPANDPPEVTAPGGPIHSTNTQTAVPGFSVADTDMDNLLSGGKDFIQVVVRLLQDNGNAFGASDYADVTIGYDTSSGASVIGGKNGTGNYLVLQGTREEINDALAGLTVAFSTDRNAIYRVQVIADDRLRNATGVLEDADPITAGTQPGANGGALNEPKTLLTTSATPVPDTELNYYTTAAIPAGLAGNVAAAEVRIYASTLNNPATLDVSYNEISVFEDQLANIGDMITFNIADAESDAFGTPVKVTLTVQSGTLNVGTTLPDGITAVTGRGSSSLTITGTATAIKNFLNTSLTYQSVLNVNHDLNGAASGDVTLTVSFDDTGSQIGSGGAQNPVPVNIALTIHPVNDRPTVSVGSGTIALVGATRVPGVVVGDLDIASDGGGIATDEANFLQVTVRITNTNGTPLSIGQYFGTRLTSINVPGSIKVDTTYNGVNAALVLRGTLADINTYLAGLTVEITGALANNNSSLRIEVIADDRIRDINTGNLASTLANGGGNNNATGGTQAVSANNLGIYTQSTAQISSLGLTPNVNHAHREIFPTSVNDPAQINVPAQQQNEGSATYKLNNIAISDSDALTSNLDVTVTLAPGFTFAALTGGGSLSNGGSTATFTGTQTAINTWVNNLTVNLPTTDGLATDWNGSFGVTIVVDDKGNNGNRPATLPGDTDDPAADPGDFEYKDGASAALITTRTFAVTIGAVNDAPRVQPVSGSTETSLTAVAEDTPGSALPGQTVSALFQPYFNDGIDGIDAITGGSARDTFAGVVVTGLVVNANQGVWEYSINNGTNWNAIGNRTDATGLHLDANALIRFVPAADFHGTPAKLTVRLAENDTGTDAPTGPALPLSGSPVNVASGNNGGTTRFSTGTVTLGITVTNVNDRPTIDNATLPNVVEDAADPTGQTVSALFGSSFGDGKDNQSGITGGGNASGTLGGIAIVGNNADPAHGVWQYHDGNGWVSIPADTSDSSALLLTNNTQIRFLPGADYNGTPGGLVVRASDQPISVVQSGVDISAGINDAAGSDSQLSVGKNLTTVVTPVNDAPVLSGTTGTRNVSENLGLGTGTGSVTLVTGAGLSDIDTTTTPDLDGETFGAGWIEIALGAYVAGDRLAIAPESLPPGVTTDLTDDGDGTKLVIKLDADTTYAEIRAILNSVTFSNTSDNPTNFGANQTRTYTITVHDGLNTDPQGDTAGAGTSLASNQLTGTIAITAVNDPPVAYDNENNVAEAGSGPGTAPTATGNVIDDPSPTNKTDGDPDTPRSGLSVTSIHSNTQGTQTVGVDPVAINGLYGTLTINADGSYTYEVNNDNPFVNGLKSGDHLNDVFSYAISDGDKGSNLATLTITINGTTDGPPAVTPADTNGHGPGADGHATVHEAGLVDGTPGSGMERTIGTIAISAPDGLSSITIGGVDVPLAALQGLAGNPVVIDTGIGTLTLTGLAVTGGSADAPVASTLSYTYVLKAAQSQTGADSSIDSIALTVTDRGGGTATGSLDVLIVDHEPVANPDVNAITRGAASDTVIGNVVPNDAPGADGAGVTGVVAGDQAGNTDLTGTAPVNPTTGVTVVGTYGTLTLRADGSYSYQLDNTNTAVASLLTGQTLNEVFTYRLTDGDGDFDLATLTITINGKADGPPAITPADTNGPGANGHATVEERGLPDGSAPRSGTATTTGTIDLAAPNGLTTITVGGIEIPLAGLQNLATHPVVIDTGEGTLTLNQFTPTGGPAGSPTAGTLTYTYTLKDNVIQPSGSGGSTDVITLSVTDTFNGSSDSALTIHIVNDRPQARNDTASVTEDAPSATISGVLTGNDTAGADGFGPQGAVTGITFDHDGNPLTPARPHQPGERFATAYGTVVVNADGSYSYTLDNANPAVTALAAGESLVETISYTITDADGDTSTATLTITIHGSNDAPVVIPGQSITGREDTPIVFGPGDFAFTDAEGDALAGVRITTLPPLGQLLLNGVAISAGDVITAADIAAGRLIYMPEPDGNGRNYTQFGFAVSDGKVFSQPGPFIIHIAPVNDTPTVDGPAGVVANEDIPLAFDGRPGPDTAPRFTIDDLVDRLQTGYSDLFTLTLSVQHGTLTIADPAGTITGEGSGGSLTISGTRDAINMALATLTYLAEYNYAGTDRLVLTLDDAINAGAGPDARPGTAVHVTDIIVNPIADAPTLTAPPTVQGEANTWVPLDVAVQPTDLSDAEIVSLDLTGLPPGWQIRVGNGAPVTSTGPDTVFNLTQADLTAGLFVLPPTGANTTITLGLRAVSQDGPVSQAYTLGQIAVTLTSTNEQGDVPPGENAQPPRPQHLDIALPPTSANETEDVPPVGDAQPLRPQHLDPVPKPLFDPDNRAGESASVLASIVSMPRNDTARVLEGWPVHRYTTTRYGIQQQVLFRYSSDTDTTNLFYEATLGRNQALPSWISFDPYTQTVLALPPEDVEPGTYLVRVLARDSFGNEAESTVTIHVLRDNGQSLEATGRKPRPQTDEQPAGEEPATEEPTADTPSEQSPQESQQPQEGAPQESAPESGQPPADPQAEPAGEDGQPAGETNAFLGGGAAGSRDFVSAEEAGTRSSLTEFLLHAGTSGRAIETARLLEALAAEVTSTEVTGAEATVRPHS